MPHPYIPNDTDEIRAKLQESICIRNVDELFSDIPEQIRLKKPLALPEPMSELEVRHEVEKILEGNRTTKEFASFLGAGSWAHHVPPLVDAVASRSEFLTSYTPYQPEISQGILQALFEYQSLICELLDMEVANCSMYGWASALGEAARMAARVTQRYEVLVPHYVAQEKLSVLRTYATSAGIRLYEVPQDTETGQIDLEALNERVSNSTAAVYVENPSYLGFLIESVKDIVEIAHGSGALFIAGIDPTSLGIFRPPGEDGADIAIGEGQPLGNYMNNGGPLLGIFACRDDPSLVRQMPGRIVGMTTAANGKERAFCMALQTREQHIRRQKATSNICTNQALCALRAAVYMTLLGRKGLRELGEAILAKAYYAIARLSRIKSVQTPMFRGYHFKEFTVNFDRASKSVREVNQRLLQSGILGGRSLSSEFPELSQTSLYCITELTTREDIDRLGTRLEEILEG